MSGVNNLYFQTYKLKRQHAGFFANHAIAHAQTYKLCCSCSGVAEDRNWLFEFGWFCEIHLKKTPQCVSSSHKSAVGWLVWIRTTNKDKRNIILHVCTFWRLSSSFGVSTEPKVFREAILLNTTNRKQSIIFVRGKSSLRQSIPSVLLHFTALNYG